MQKSVRRIAGWCLATALSAAALTSTGCDPTMRSAVEDGIITASQSLFGAFLQAAIQLASEDPNTTTS